VRSASRKSLGKAVVVTAAILASGLLAGCATTKEKAARLQLNAARLTDAQYKTRVVNAGGPVKAIRTAVISTAGRSAFVVTVSNDSGATIGDLPISVGYVLGSKRVYLNDRAGLAYFGAHLPAVRAHQELTWVYRSGHAVPHGARPFARVGARPSPRALFTSDASVSAVRSGIRKQRLLVKVTNLSDIPQYQLQVYAYSRDEHGYVAAGAGSVGELDPGATQNLKLVLVGRTSANQIKVEAVPTILQ
jgi:hypothetical protein